MNFPANTAEELIAYAKANPGKLNYASQGPGSTSHLTGVMFTQQTGAEMVHVPYRGTGPALADILAGNVDLFFDNLGSSLPMHRGGKAKILAVATPERSKLLPEVPTLREAGLRDFSSSTWFAIVAPPHAGGDRRSDQPGGQRNPGDAGHPGAVRDARRAAALSRRRSLRRSLRAKRSAGPTSRGTRRSRRSSALRRLFRRRLILRDARLLRIKSARQKPILTYFATSKLCAKSSGGFGPHR